jgi:O-antigen ligase
MKPQLQRFLPPFTLLIYSVAATVGAFAGGLWAALAIGMAFLLFLGTSCIDEKWSMPERQISVLAILALMGIAALNVQSVEPFSSWVQWAQLVTIFLPLSLLTSASLPRHAWHPRFFSVLALAALFGAGALSIELYLGCPLLQAIKGAGASPTQYNRGLSYLVMLVFPIMAGLSLRGRRSDVVAFGLAFLIPVELTESRAAKLALILGLSAIVLTYYLPVLMRRVLTVLPFVLCTWPFAAQQFFRMHYDALKHFPDSWRARMEIWDYMSYRIAERPWLGWGLGSAHDLPFQAPHGAQYVFTVTAASHPHNVVTELWVELGVPGLVLGLAFALMTLRKAFSLAPDLQPFAVGAWMAALSLSLVAYHFWTDSLFGAFALAAFAFSLAARQQKTAILSEISFKNR